MASVTRSSCGAGLPLAVLSTSRHLRIGPLLTAGGVASVTRHQYNVEQLAEGLAKPRCVCDFFVFQCCVDGARMNRRSLVQAIANDKNRDSETPTADPTISDVLAAYVADQKAHLSAESFDRCVAVLELLQDSLNGYAHNSLDKEKLELWEERFNAEGGRHQEFCEIFGPDEILPNIGEFLGYFMVRKVMVNQALLRASGTVTKKLAKWLADKGYATAEESEKAMKRGADAARDLPRAQRLCSLLYDFSSSRYSPKNTDIEDQFEIMRVEPGKIWLQGFGDDRLLGPIGLPVEATKLCRVGWTISGAARITGKKQVLVTAWSVYP